MIPRFKKMQETIEGSTHPYRRFIMPAAPTMAPTNPIKRDNGRPDENLGVAPLKGTNVEPLLAAPDEAKAEPSSPPVRFTPFGCGTII